MVDLQAIAYQTDMTRVITFMFGRAGSNRPYRPIGISDGHHSLTHHMNDPEKIEKVAQDRRLPGEEVRHVPGEDESDAGRADGKLLDNMMICYGS